MGNNIFQIRRTSVTGREANTTTLTNAGELALNILDGRMFSTNGTAIFEIGANTRECRVTETFYVGNSTVNVSTNSSTFSIGSNVVINPLNLRIGNTTVNAFINSVAWSFQNSTVTLALSKPTAAQVTEGNYFLASDSTWKQVGYQANAIPILGDSPNSSMSTANDIYWDSTLGRLFIYYDDGVTEQWVDASPFYPEGSNTEIQYNDSGTMGANNLFTFAQDTTTLSLGSNLTINTSTAFIGNSTVNALANSTLIKIHNATSSANLAASGLVVGTSVVNTTVLAAGADAILGTVDLRLGNSTVNAVANSLSFVLSNSTVTFSITKPTAAQVSSGDYFLGSDGTWQQATGAAGAGGDNTEVQFNNSGTLDGSNGFTFDASANVLVVANTIATAIVSCSNLVLGSNLSVNLSTILIGNSTVNTLANSTLIKIHDATSSANLGASGLAVGTSVVNTTTFAAGANVVVGTVAVSIGNSTVNALANSVLIKVHDATSSANLAASGLVVGTSVVNTTVLAAGSDAILGTVDLRLGNSTVNAVANSLALVLSNSTVSFSVTKPTAAQNTAGDYFLGANGTWQHLPDAHDAIGITIDGGGEAITTGVKGYISVPYNCTIQAVTMLADQTGSIVVDIWKDTYANYPPTDADTITASAVPTISSANKSTDATLTGWTTSISADDVLGFNVDSATTITRLTLVLKVLKT